MIIINNSYYNHLKCWKYQMAPEPSLWYMKIPSTAVQIEWVNTLLKKKYQQKLKLKRNMEKEKEERKKNNETLSTE